MSNLLVPMILAFFLPGIGQGYLTKKWGKAIIYLIASAVLSFILVGFLLWVYGLYDTYKIAKAQETGQQYKSLVFGEISKA